MSKRDLWNRISNYHFEHIVQPELMDKVNAMFGGADASTQAFASKLAMKLGWSRKFALRAIAEYRKFVYLGNVGRVNVTPSKVIDQVWHQHILFSRAYREFCRDIIGRDFDHNPELVPLAEQSDLFAQQYLATLDAYRTEFNMMPPADIWSVPKFRNQELKRAPKKLEKATSDYWGGEAPLYSYYSSEEMDKSSSSAAEATSVVVGRAATGRTRAPTNRARAIPAVTARRAETVDRAARPAAAEAAASEVAGLAHHH